ncbi:MAG: hypothetical protein V7785_21830 [Bermanella sp.]
MNECTEERFFEDTANHTMKIIRDDDVCRHISFKNGGSSIYGFDLITWAGYLLITGDCGTYVFRRIHDMFEFFATDEKYKKAHPETKLFINPRYWGEKLESICRTGGYREYNEEAFIERITEHFNSYWEDAECTEGKDELWAKIKDDVLWASDYEHEAYQAVNEFSYEDFEFADFFDGGGTDRYTFHYLWCLFAITHGVEQYHNFKALPGEEAA